MILTIFLSSVTSTLASQSADKSITESVEGSQEVLEDLLTEISDPNQLQEDASDQISNLINPENETFSILSTEYSDMSNVILEKLYTSWISNPTSYSFVEQEVSGWNITNIQTPEQAVSIHETTTADGRKTTRTTIYSERPYIKLIDSGDSFIDDINIPVIPEPAGIGADVAEYKTITKRVNFGWELPSLHCYEELKSTPINPAPFIIGVRFRVWVGFDFKFHLFFPVDVTISYPTQIIEGHSYEFNCTVVPIDDPDMHEFEFLLDAKAGWNIELGFWIPGWWELICRSTCCVPLINWPCWGCNCYWYWHTPYNTWVQIAGNEWSIKKTLQQLGLPDYTHLTGDYKTPLGSNSIPLPLPFKIDILDIIGKFCPPVAAIADFLSAEIRLGTANVYGDAVKAKMSILSKDEEVRDVAFADENGDTARMIFTIPNSEQTPNVELSVTQFEYKFKKIEFNPYLYLGFDEVEMHTSWGDCTLPLDEWFGGIDIPLPKFAIPLEASIESKFNYYSAGISITEDYSAIYDFDMSVNDWYSGYTPYGLIQQYLIDLSNPNLRDQQNDVIKLSVGGLPEGYEASFDAPQGEYRLSGISSELEEQIPLTVWSDDYPKWAVKTVYSPFGASGINRALLTILKTGSTDAPPGTWTFDIIANSTQKVNHQVPDPAITKIATLDVPQIHGIDLQLDDTLYNEIPVIPGEYFPINFFGQNLGNVNDTVNVSAILEIGDTARTWSEVCKLDPYGSTPNQYYSGQFGFMYDRTDLFPYPGIYMLEITANNSRTAYIDKRLRLFLNFTEAYGVEASISPITTTVLANWETNFTLSFNNTGNTLDNFTIESQGWDDYLTYPQQITNVEPMRPQEVTISLSIPDPNIITPDIYHFRIIIKSEGDKSLTAFSVQEVNITILAPESIPPRIVQVDYPREVFVYPESPLTLGPTWKAYDEWNDTYTIYIDGKANKTGNWNVGAPIQAPVTGDNQLTLGHHNVTITFSDESNNIATSQTWVKIEPLDTIAPLIVPIPGKTAFPLNFSRPQSFYWNCTEEYVYDYQILVNGTPVPLTWQHNLCMKGNPDDRKNFIFNYTIYPQILSEGTWNITLVLQDMSNNTASDSVFITIAGPDSKQPSITESPISSANLGHGTTFQITTTDAFPDKYKLWVGTTLLSSGSWESEVPLIFNVDDIDILVGANALKIDLIDLADNLVSYQWTLSLSDIDAPTLLAAPPNLILYEHNYTQLIPPYWSVEDLDPRPGTFTITLDDVTITEGSWTNANGSFYLPIPHLLPGTHHYDAYFYDATGNPLHSPVDLTLYDITKPAISAIDNIHFDPLYSADWFEYYISELHLAQFSLYRNGTLVDSDPLTEGFPYVFVRIIGISIGSYNYTLVVEDESRNIGSLSIRVQVTDYTPPLIVRPFDIVISEGAPNQMITWEIQESNPLNYSIYRNGVLLEYGALTSSTLSKSLSELTLGSYTYTLIVFDEFGQSHSCTSYVTITDITPPACPHISDCQFELGNENAELIWNARDLHPATYQVNVNGSLAEEMLWDGNDIALHLLGWASGTYRVEIFIKDTSGNIATDEVIVRIIEEETVSEVGSGFEIMVILTVIALILGKRKFEKKY